MGLLRENLLTLATMAGVVAGVGLGLGLKASGDGVWSAREAHYVGYPGRLFLNMLKCLILPLIVPSLISSIGQLDLRLSGRVGGRAVGYYLVTTLLAVSLGILLCTTIQPGSEGGQAGREAARQGGADSGGAADTLLDLLTNCFPPNLVQATMQQYKTVLEDPGQETVEDEETGAMLVPGQPHTWRLAGSWTHSTNILGLVVFSLATGVSIALSGQEGRPLLAFFQSLSAVMMRVTGWVVHLAPVGVCFLIAGEILQMRSVLVELQKLAWYLLTVTLGISLHGLLVLPAIYCLVTRRLPFSFIGKMGPALATAFGTASSSATLPITVASLEQGNKIDPRISRFVLPIGATINMDGTALYEAVAAIFIAQLSGLSPTLGQVVIISITATAASIGAAGIPHAGLVTLVMVLETVGLPSEAVSIVMSVDWLVDRVRTAVNVLGDAFGAAIVAHLSRAELAGGEEEAGLAGEQSKLLLHTLEDGAGDQPEKKEEISLEQAVIQAGSPKCYCEGTGRAKSRCVEM